MFQDFLPLSEDFHTEKTMGSNMEKPLVYIYIYIKIAIGGRMSFNNSLYNDACNSECTCIVG